MKTVRTRLTALAACHPICRCVLFTWVFRKELRKGSQSKRAKMVPKTGPGGGSQVTEYSLRVREDDVSDGWTNCVFFDIWASGSCKGTYLITDGE